MISEAELLTDEIAECADDPIGFCAFAFPWGEDGPLAKMQGPRKWQRDILGEIGTHLRSPNRFQPLQIAVASGHGIGKSALIAMIINWAMSTCADTRCIITANTATQLETKTCPELAKWTKMALNADWWKMTLTRMVSSQDGHAGSWRTDAIPWSADNTEAFAGTHNEGRRIVIVFDEASAIDDTIWEVTEGALTDENTEIIWLAFGNPTQNTGRFRECFGKYKHRWKTFQIDSRTVEGTNKAQLDKWVEDYGEDSDFCRVRVRGEFPRAGSTQFISGEAVAACRKYKATGYEGLSKILSVDVARFGDDESVIGLRQGRYFTVLKTFRGMATDQLAGRVIEFIESESPDMTVVDGGGVGGGVIDTIRSRGYGKRLHEYNSGHTPENVAKYYNKRAEVWGEMRDWLIAGAQIPDDPELDTEISSPDYFLTNKQQIQIESKDDMKARGLGSPDKADCLAMTFAVKVLPKPKVAAPIPYGGSTGWMA